MPPSERVTVTLPIDLVEDIDRRETNRSKFVADAVRHELELRRRDDLRRSLENPYPESVASAELGFDEWAHGLSTSDSEQLFDSTAGKAVRWIPGQGWVEEQQ